MRTDPVARFWARVDKSGGPDACWPWLGSRNPKNGYGNCYWNGRHQGTHRIAEELTRGPLPPKIQALHTCDNPPCCNPAHLFRGTVADNMHDRDRKGRNGALGNRWCAKITTDDVQWLRAQFAANPRINQAALGRKLGISRGTVCAIVHNTRWQNL